MESIKWSISDKSRKEFVIEGSISINVAARDIWEILTTEGHLTRVHDKYAKHFCQDWSGVGSKDTLVYVSGGRRTRTVVEWEKDNYLLLSVMNEKHQSDVFVHYSIKEEESSTVLCIKQVSTNFSKVPRLIWRYLTKKKIVASHKKYYEELLIGLKTLAEELNTSA